MTIARILTIAGSDSGGGAGIQADVRTISHIGGHAMTAITAITAQNSKGVFAMEMLDAKVVLAQIDAVVSDFGVDAIKIGMAGNHDSVLAIADYIAKLDSLPIIFDPVMVASSGAELANDQTIEAFWTLIQSVTLLTPNLPEYDRLSHHISLQDYPCDVLIKGGHDKGELLVDRLIRSDKEIKRWESKRIETRHNHGTGCTLSSAIATYMGQGNDVVDAITKARQYVRASLYSAPNIGTANGPMGVPRTW